MKINQQKNFIFSIIIALLISSHVTFSQNSASVVLLQGKVMDFTNNPVGSTIIFTTESGKKVTVKSNSTDGSYQQPLQAGETYSIVIKDFILLSDKNTITLPTNANYTEITKNFNVRKIESGIELFQFTGFSPNKTILNSGFENYFRQLKDLLTANPKISYVITVHSHDTKFKPGKKNVTVEIKGKKKTKSVKVTEEEMAEEFIKQRVTSLREELKKYSIPERSITIIPDTKKINVSEKPSKKDKKTKTQPIIPQNSNVYVKIGKIMDL